MGRPPLRVIDVAVLVLVLACGETRDNGASGVPDPGAHGTSGANGRDSGSDGGFASHLGKGTGGTGTAGTAGAIAGERGSSGGDAAGLGGSFPSERDGGSATPACPVPTAELPSGTTAEKERAALIHAFCVALDRDGCVGELGGSSFVSEQASGAGCSAADRIRACEFDQAYEYTQYDQPACDDAWRTAITCAADASYTQAQCFTADLGTTVTGGTIPCAAEKAGLGSCGSGISAPSEATGSRGTCRFGTGVASPCEVNCSVSGNAFLLDCGGPAGLPLRCTCSVNGTSLGDDDFGAIRITYASDCADAATRAANGACTNRLDCCVHFIDNGVDRCLCGSEPSSLGYPTCLALAQGIGGDIVDRCPQYTPVVSTCWPPPCTQ